MPTAMGKFKVQGVRVCGVVCLCVCVCVRACVCVGGGGVPYGAAVCAATSN